MNYGLPYQGSKNTIARWVVDHLPPADCFVDLFAGGCAVTHAAILSGKYKRFIVNDIDPMMPRTFVAAINGAFRDERRVITREEFDALKATDPYVAICWSFGNNGQDYLWNEDTAGARLLACRLVLSDSYAERINLYRQFIKYLQQKRAELQERQAMKGIREQEIGDLKEYLRGELCRALKASGKTQAEVNKHLNTQMGRHYFGRSQWAFPTREQYDRLRELLTTLPPYDYYGQDLQSLQNLESLEGLEYLQSLQRLERLQRLESTCPRVPIEVRDDDYRDFVMPGGNVLVYCDPPYKGMTQYRIGQFDSEAFHAWAATRPNVVISEYDMPADRFKCIAEVRKSVRMAATGTGRTHAIERLFVPRCSPLQEYKPQNNLFND